MNPFIEAKVEQFSRTYGELLDREHEDAAGLVDFLRIALEEAIALPKP